LDFSKEGSLLASGSADQTVRLWDINGALGRTPADTQIDLTKMEVDTTVPAITNSQKTKSTENISAELIKTFPTKNTPIFKTLFTRRNLLLAAGPFSI